MLDKNNDYDLIFTCPPYYNLEVYGDGDRDMSAAKDYDSFLLMYEESMKKAINKLKPNRFMIYTITNIKVINKVMGGERVTPDDDGMTTPLIELIVFYSLYYFGYF